MCRSFFMAVAVLTFTAVAANGQVITQWNFNSTAPDANVATGVLTPSAGSGTASLIGSTTSTFATGSPGDPASSGSDNSGLNVTTFAAQGTNSGTAGTQFLVSTVGSTGPISISLDFRQSGTVSRFFELLATSDGVNYNPVTGGTATFGTVNTNTATSFTNGGIYSNNPGGGSQTFVQTINYTFAGGSEFENDANFGFRWVAIFDQSGTAPGNYIAANAGTAAGYSTSGTARFDMVTVRSVPEPTSIALTGLFGLAAVARAARRKNRAATI